MTSRLSAALLAILTLVIAGCATIDGAGQDISTAGEAISGASNDVEGAVTGEDEAADADAIEEVEDGL